MTAKSFLNQNFDELKKKCLQNKILFEDNTFPANKLSISNKTNDGESYIWKRPFELCPNPVFLVEENPSWFINQGQLGDCWLISGITGISTSQDCFNRIVPKEQNFVSDYAGIFKFKFWHFGEWVQVVVDDRLPVKNDKLVFCKNLKHPNEMYGPLLEKAYAKLNRCYFNLISGEINDSLTDLTGGLHQNFNLKNITDQDQLWMYTVRLLDCKSMAGCAIDLPKDEKSELVLENKLKTGHTYAVLDTVEFESLSNKSKTRLIKLRNPWGHEISWTGKWAWNSQEWNDVPENIKTKLNLISVDNNGQFYISFEDFLKYFNNLDFVHINPFINDPECKEWHCEQFKGEWKAGLSAGGSFNSGKESFFSNPKYLINCDQSDSVVISLMQTDTLRIRERNGKLKGSREALGFHIYTLLNNDPVLTDSNLKFYSNSGEYVYKRELNRKFDLTPGRYVLVPTCFKKNANMKYLLRIFSKSNETKTQQLNLHYKAGSIVKSRVGHKQKIVKKSYINEANRDKNKTIGMHLTKIDHEDFSEACAIM
ncbi:calpain-2 catalytic subunit-like [Brachionus plicatilis]|uniref:Calpain-2 catalytic subunit-like n=1 Tax=Brachionus plicatilis TaxID=10195 RepID=A0A3M7RP05_BRAPC|nr:calpain-2 catalytic subunit-like [Brachionus plicatilis]